jgi:hypothetical protein
MGAFARKATAGRTISRASSSPCAKDKNSSGFQYDSSPTAEKRGFGVIGRY